MSAVPRLPHGASSTPAARLLAAAAILTGCGVTLNAQLRDVPPKMPSAADPDAPIPKPRSDDRVHPPLKGYVDLCAVRDVPVLATRYVKLTHPHPLTEAARARIAGYEKLLNARLESPLAGAEKTAQEDLVRSIFKDYETTIPTLIDVLQRVSTPAHASDLPKCRIRVDANLFKTRGRPTFDPEIARPVSGYVDPFDLTLGAALDLITAPIQAVYWIDATGIVIVPEEAFPAPVLAKNRPSVYVPLDEERLPIKPDVESLRVEGRLNRPAYVYVVRVHADGKAELMYPVDRHGRRRMDDEPTTEIALVPSSAETAFGGDAPGTETILMLASEKRPPADFDIAKKFDSGAKQISHESRKLAWFENGLPADLGDGRAAIGKKWRSRYCPLYEGKPPADDPVVEIQARVQSKAISSQFALVRAVCYSTAGGKP